MRLVWHLALHGLAVAGVRLLLLDLLLLSWLPLVLTRLVIL